MQRQPLTLSQSTCLLTGDQGDHEEHAEADPLGRLVHGERVIGLHEHEVEREERHHGGNRRGPDAREPCHEDDGQDVHEHCRGRGERRSERKQHDGGAGNREHRQRVAPACA